MPASGGYFRGGIVAATREQASGAGVPEETLLAHGMVSPATAAAMAEAARASLNADFGIGIAGVLGPQEQEGEPVGQVYIGIAGPDGVRNLEMRTPPAGW